ncbi:MAG: hypothetical protein ACR2F8_02060 [Caulobacteraceae bacterium]
MTRTSAPSETTRALNPKAALKLQRAYAAKRRAWAKAVGRPYTRDRDPRPPPGELDAAADESG